MDKNGESTPWKRDMLLSCVQSSTAKYAQDQQYVREAMIEEWQEPEKDEKQIENDQH
jgi:hypothetical protein